MQTWIALFRGINVGGHHSLPMAKLRADLESLGLVDAQTYIQSGNCVFQSTVRSSTALKKKIGDMVQVEHGFRPEVLLLSNDQFQRAVDQNPYREAIEQPTTLHFFFLAQPASSADLAGLDKIKAANERYYLTDDVFYLHAPDGIGRSKLAAKAEKHLGVLATARNYRTVSKLLELVTARN